MNLPPFFACRTNNPTTTKLKSFCATLQHIGLQHFQCFWHEGRSLKEDKFRRCKSSETYIIIGFINATWGVTMMPSLTSIFKIIAVALPANRKVNQLRVMRLRAAGAPATSTSCEMATKSPKEHMGSAFRARTYAAASPQLFNQNYMFCGPNGCRWRNLSELQWPSFPYL